LSAAAKGDRKVKKRWTGDGRAMLDLVATIVMLSVAGVFVVVAAYSYLQQPFRPPYILTEPPLPAELLSIEGATTAGCPSAPIAIIVYADFRCAACGLFAQHTLPTIRERYVDTCKVLIAFRSVPINARDPFAVRTAEAAACAGRQGLFWPMHDLLFAEQPQKPSTDMKVLVMEAKKLGLDESEFNACLNARLALPQIRQDAGEAVTLGVSGTPTVFFGLRKPKNKVLVVRRVGRALEIEEVDEILRGLLRGENGSPD
jgi:protein-disulfide isomerase